jgi:hypothetical protein
MANETVLPLVGSLSLSGQTPIRAFGLLLQSDAPTLISSSPVITVGTGSISYAGNAPEITRFVTPPTGSLGLSGNVPIAVVPIPPTGSLSFTTTDAEFINSGDMRWILQGYAPVAINQDNNQTVSPSAGSLSLSGQTPIRAFGLFFTGNAPALLENHISTPSVGSIGLTGYGPQILAEPPDKVAPETGALAFSSDAPSINVGLLVPVASLSLSGQSPTKVVDTTILVQDEPDGKIISLRGLVPTISVDYVGDGETLIQNADATQVKSSYLIDDRTGFKRKIKQGLVEDGYGYLVREDSADRRHPQERVKSTSEDYRTGALRPEIVKEADMTFIDPDDPVTPDDL